jgi:hypothetical protein
MWEPIYNTERNDIAIVGNNTLLTTQTYGFVIHFVVIGTNLTRRMDGVALAM